MQSRNYFFGLEMSQVEMAPFLLNKFLNEVKPQTIIEIGTFKGGISTLFQMYALLSKYLKSGDYILAHDYAQNKKYFDEQIKGRIWDWCEITDQDIQKACEENNLEKTYLEFDSVAITCRVKK